MAKKNGFTLVELIITILVAAIVMGAATALLMQPIRAAILSRQINQASLIAQAISDYMRDELVFASGVSLTGVPPLPSPAPLNPQAARSFRNDAGAANRIGGIPFNDPHYNPGFFNETFFGGMNTSFRVRKVDDTVLEIRLTIIWTGTGGLEHSFVETFSVRCENLPLIGNPNTITGTVTAGFPDTNTVIHYRP